MSATQTALSNWQASFHPSAEIQIKDDRIVVKATENRTDVHLSCNIPEEFTRSTIRANVKTTNVVARVGLGVGPVQKTQNIAVSAHYLDFDFKLSSEPGFSVIAKDSTRQPEQRSQELVLHNRYPFASGMNMAGVALCQLIGPSVRTVEWWEESRLTGHLFLNLHQDAQVEISLPTIEPLADDVSLIETIEWSPSSGVQKHSVPGVLRLPSTSPETLMRAIIELRPKQVSILAQPAWMEWEPGRFYLESIGRCAAHYLAKLNIHKVGE